MTSIKDDTSSFFKLSLGCRNLTSFNYLASVWAGCLEAEAISYDHGLSMRAEFIDSLETGNSIGWQ